VVYGGNIKGGVGRRSIVEGTGDMVLVCEGKRGVVSRATRWRLGHRCGVEMKERKREIWLLKSDAPI
jgi:hypothetical protein